VPWLEIQGGNGLQMEHKFEKMNSCWSGCHSHNHFREFVEDFCYAWNHVKRYIAWVRKVDNHS
jgi:hypothetical protein